MKLYEEKDQKRDIQCAYCFRSGHNKRNCPTMKANWEANPQVHDTYDHNSLVGIDKTLFPSAYHRWYGDDDAKRQFRAHWEYMKKRFAPVTEKKKPKKRRKTKCGFCGSTAHTRRNCNKMKNFVYVLKETNKAYRSAFYDKFIEGMGMGAGALVTIRNGMEPSVGLITSFPSDEIMFTNLLRTWSDYHTKAIVAFNLQGDNIRTNMASSFFHSEETMNEDFDEKVGIWRNMYSFWGTLQSVVSPAPNRPTKEWFMGQAPCFDWVVKKRDQATLMRDFYLLIKHFYPHDNLRTKLGAKIYDRYYTQ